MRESNFSFPAQNRACVCITSQLYDRRALDTNSPLPLFNSLTHLTYLTSTSPRIREILTADGGLERLVRLLRDFASSPPPPEVPSLFYGLMPPGVSMTSMMTKANPNAFDQHAAYRFSLAFQCVVNIGVRGSEAIRSRVVQAGTLDVVGCILETWLRSKGFVTFPSPTASGVVRERETKEQRAARRAERSKDYQAAMAAQQGHHGDGHVHASQLHRASGATVLSDVEMGDGDSIPDDASAVTARGFISPSRPLGGRDRDRSATITARPQPRLNIDGDVGSPPHASTHPRRRPSRSHRANGSDAAGPSHLGLPHGHHHHHHRRHSPPSSHSHGNPNPDITSTSASASDASPSRSPSPGLGQHDDDDDDDVGAGVIHTTIMPAHAVGIVDADPSSPTTFPQHTAMNMDLFDPGIVMNMRDGLGIGPLDVNAANEDLAMGAPPGAPGAAIDIEAPVPESNPDSGAVTPVTGMELEMPDGQNGENGNANRTPRTSVDSTPRATIGDLPVMGAIERQVSMPARPTTPPNFMLGNLPHHRPHMTPPPRPAAPAPISPPTTTTTTATMTTVSYTLTSSHNSYGSDVPYKDDDVLLSLQLLAYLSKYPHVRQAFYKPRTILGETKDGHVVKTAGTYPSSSSSGRSGKDKEKEKEPSPSTNALLKVLGVGKSAAASKEKEKEKEKDKEKATTPTESAPPTLIDSYSPNVFALVERFTFRPHPSELTLPNPPPYLPPEIAYWAGVIMRNACRKDDSRGGIRQCASMVCGKWEKYPREFAKCRRCRKARYCGKECQSKAWAEGHRFWCSARESGNPDPNGAAGSDDGHGAVPGGVGVTGARWLARTRRDATGRGAHNGGLPLPMPGAGHLGHAARFGRTAEFIPPPTVTWPAGTHTMVVRMNPHHAGTGTGTGAPRRPPPPHAGMIQIPRGQNSIVVGDPRNTAYDSDGGMSPPAGEGMHDVFSRAANRRAVETNVVRGSVPARRRPSGATTTTAQSGTSAATGVRPAVSSTRTTQQHAGSFATRPPNRGRNLEDEDVDMETLD